MADAGFGNKTISIGQRRYLGSKTKLLTFIDEVLIKENVSFDSFADIFGGTGVVANYFHTKSHIVVNDILESNYICYQAFFSKNRIRTKWLAKKIDEYNNIDIESVSKNYFSTHFANTYFNEANSKHIGYIRENIEQLSAAKTINSRERAYLVTALLYALDRIAHTVGHYDAFRKVDIPSHRLVLRPLSIISTKYASKIYKTDANELVKHIKTDVVYIDPPYNSRQYSDSYHLLENIASWEKNPVAGIAKKIDRAHIKSAYSLKSAGYAFSELIDAIDAKYILMSYNDMGTSGDPRSQSRISDNELISALERKGRVTVYEKSYNQFTTGCSKRDDLMERIFFCRVTKKQLSRINVARSARNSNSNIFVKSPLNYTGGKHKLLPQLNTFWPTGISTFYDIFCGSANVGINAQADNIVCIDKSSDVIEVLQLMKHTNFEDLNQMILRVIKRYGLSQSFIQGYKYYQAASSTGLGAFNNDPYRTLRNAYNQSTGSDKPLLLLVLILYGFNNQIRFNANNEFNLPVGKRDYNGNSRRNLANFNAITNAKKIAFIAGDFKSLLNVKFQPQDFIYLDPPYLLGLASYNESSGWSRNEENELYRVLLELSNRGLRFALSNVSEHKGESNTLLLDWVAKNNFRLNYLDYHYKNSNYQSTAKYGITKEILVTNYVLPEPIK